MREGTFSGYTELVEHRYRLGADGPSFFGRDVAKPIRRRLEALLEGARPGDIVVLDTEGVVGFDFSFAAELLLGPLSSLDKVRPGRFLVVENLNEVARENLTIALMLNDVAIVERAREGLRILGKVGSSDQETFDALADTGGQASAPELATQLGIALTATNERLVKLVRLGIVRREDPPPSSRAYRYTAPN